MRGRKPKPTFLKLVDGNPGQRPINIDEPEPDGDLIDPPDYFSPRQRILWDMTMRNAPAGMLKKLDTAVLEVYIVAKSLFEDATRHVNEFGAMVTKRKQVAHNPYVSIVNKQALIMLKAASSLGFDPTSRSRVKVPGRKKTKGAFAKLRELKV